MTQSRTFEATNTYEGKDSRDEYPLGTYTTVRSVNVRENQDVRSPKVTKLSKQENVEVVEVRVFPSGCVRARIAEPAGWTSLVSTSGKQCLAPAARVVGTNTFERIQKGQDRPVVGINTWEKMKNPQHQEEEQEDDKPVSENWADASDDFEPVSSDDCHQEPDEDHEAPVANDGQYSPVQSQQYSEYALPQVTETMVSVPMYADAYNGAWPPSSQLVASAPAMYAPAGDLYAQPVACQQAGPIYQTWDAAAVQYSNQQQYTDQQYVYVQCGLQQC